MEFQFFLNNTQIFNQPFGWEDFEETFELDEEVRGLLLKYNSKLTFWGDGYAFLEAIRQTSGGYCQRVDVTIKGKATQSGSFKDRILGTINIVDIVWGIGNNDGDGPTAETTIEDRSFTARIKNNSESTYWLNANVSKNGVSITPITTIALTVYRPSDGLNYGPTREVYDLKDSLEYLVSAMTDNTVSFASTWYDSLPDDEHWSVCYGNELRTASSTLAPLVSWENLFSKTIALLYNLWFIVEVDTTTGNSVIRIEDDDYLHSSVRLNRIQYIADLKQSFDFDKMYRSVELGQEDSIKDLSGTYSLPYLQFLSFVEEEYQILGTCNDDNTLNLRTEYIIDTNVIEASLGGNDDYDDDIFLIQYDASTNIATKGYYLSGDDVTPTNPALYNEQALNANVSARWKLQGNPAVFYSNQDDSFEAQLVSDTGTFTANGIGSTVLFDTHPYPFDNEISDPNNNYDSVTNYRYVAPAQGYYITKMVVDWEITAISGNMRVGPELYIHRHETVAGGGALLTSGQYIEPILDGPNAVGTYRTELVYGSSMKLLQYFDTRISFTARGSGIGTPSVTIKLLKSSTFKSTLVATGGGEFANVNPDLNYINLFEFQRTYSTDDWDALKANPTRYLEINTNGNDDRISYIRKIDHNLHNRETKFQLRANNDQQVK